LLVSTGPFYRPPLALAERPDLAAAFELGRRDRDAPRRWEDMTDAERNETSAMDREAVRAYGLGRRGETWAPAPLPLALIGPAVDCVVGVWLQRQRPQPRRAMAWLIAGATVAGTVTLTQSADRWRGRRLALDPADAPVPAGVMSRLGVRMLLVLAYGLWIRGRTGRWPRTSPASIAAGHVIEEVERRRSWRAALAAGRDKAAATTP
jgi:hypothetical protein